MHKFIIILFLVVFAHVLSAQTRIIPSDEQPYTAESLVGDKFIGTGVRVLNITHDGTANSVGFFSGFMPSIGFDEGLVLSTGDVNTINSNNFGNVSNTTSNTLFSDSDLEQITGTSQIFDITRLTIEFIPLSDSISFNYIFASEEYPEFVCSQFNDIFGFFLSGPNPDGGSYNAENIALIPDPTDPSGDTFLDIPVQINTVNSGIQGSNNNTDLENCESPLGSLNFSQYYNDNPIGSFPMFDGFIDPFKAKASVVPCETYTMKIIIADVVDRDFDSGVFLEAKSFSSGFLQVETESQSVDGTLAEGCTPGSLIFETQSIQEENYIINLNLLNPLAFPDAAEPGVDFTNFPSQVIIPAGQSSVSVPLNIELDNIEEGIEYIYFDVFLNQCEKDTIRIAIADDFVSQVSLPNDTTICALDSLLLQPMFPEGWSVPTPRQFNNNMDIQITDESIQYISEIDVQNVEPNNLNDRYFRSICIDTFIGRNLNDYDFFIRGPEGQLMELSTDNGFKNNNDADIDTFLSTCFTLDANLNINNGNEFQGNIYPTNQTYSGNYLPEGDWADLFYSNNAAANGIWQLIILADEPATPSDISAGLPVLSAWSVNFYPDYQTEIKWYKDGQLVDCGGCFEQVIFPEGPEQHVIEVIDSRGCMAYDTINVDIFDLVVPPSNVLCADASFTSIDISWDDLGAMFSYQYQIDNSGLWIDLPPGGIFTIAGLDLNTAYTISIRTVTDRCFSESVTINCETEPCPQPTGMVVNASESSCFLGADAEITISASGGSGGPFTYMLQGQTNMDGVFTNLVGGPDFVIITDNIGCPFELPVDIPRPDEIDVQIMTDSISCFGLTDGRIEISVQGDFPPYDVEWEDGTSVLLRENLSEGWYVLTITDANNCERVDSIFIDEPTEHRFISVDKKEITCFGDDDGGYTLIHFGGTAPYTYDWNSGQNLRVISDIGPGDYSCTVYDARGCTFVFEDELIEPDTIIIQPFGNEVDCFLTDQGLAWVEISGGVEPYSFLWEDGSVNDSLIGTTGGDHFVTITDFNGCVNSVTAEVISPDSIPMNLISTPASCFEAADGTATVSSAPGNSFLWDNGQTTNMITNLAAGLYCVTVTDPANCTNERCVTVREPERIQVDFLITNPNCASDEDGSIEAIPSGGNDPYIVEWSNSDGFSSMDFLIENLAIGTYDLVVTDAAGCMNTFSIDLEPETVLSFTFATDTIDCAGTNTGMISVIPDGGTGPYLFEWTGPAGLMSSDSILTDVFAGDYMLSAIDALGCTGNTIVNIPERESIDIDLISITEVECGGSATGGLEIDVNGGLGPYSFEWNNGLVSQNLNGVRAGIYTVIVRDALDCVESETYEIPENPIIEIATDVQNASCSGQTLGSITANVNGGFPPYQYSLNGMTFTSGNSFTQLNTGLYDLVVQDALGCEAELNNIEIIEEFSIGLELPGGIVVGFDETTTVTPILTGEVSGVTYSWTMPDPDLLSCLTCDQPEIGPIIENTTLSLTVENAFGCLARAIINISVDKEIIVKVPTAFSPDNNGVNDVLNVFGRDGTTIISFKVYTRWGELVYRNSASFLVNDESVGWDGTFEGTLLDPGVYNYMIEAEFVDGSQKFVKGQTTLIR